MKYLLGFVAVTMLLAKAPDTPVPNRAPLQPNVLYELPLGSVKPSGWLKQQLRIQADGLTGHIEELWPDLGEKSVWLGGDGAGWEQGPAYMDGLLPLAYLLDDPLLIAKARKWVDYTLTHQRPSGALGPETVNGKPATDWWPNIVMLKVLTQYQEVTGDERVIPALEKYFAYQAQELEKNPLRELAQYRWGDEILSVIWLYNRNGDAKLLDLARQISSQGFDWKSMSADYPFKEKVDAEQGKPSSHGVNNAMGLKTSALWSVVSGDTADRDASRNLLLQLDRYHGLPSGAFSAGEHVAGRDPSQGTELCTLVEQMFSLEQLIQIYGDPHLANRLERLAFNALPANFTKDMWAHQADQRVNQVLADSQSHPFGMQTTGECCTANMHQGWPKFVASLWMGTADNGIAAVAYSPSEVRTTVGGTAVHITEETAYPFSEEISIKIDPAQPATFPLRLRIPGWTSGLVLRVNGAAQRDVKPGTFYTISREWREGDTIVLKMPMPVMVSHAFRNSVVVNRGPLMFSLAIGEKWKQVGSRKTADRSRAGEWEVTPTTPWNYALVINQKDPQSSFSVNVKAMAAQPFSAEGTPIEIRAHALPVRDWKLVESAATPLPESPVKAGGRPVDVVLIPYGAAKLRITEFPEVQK